MFNYVLKKIVGTKNQRELKKMQPVVARINEREGWAKSLSDERMREQIRAFRKEVSDAPEKEKSAVLADPLRCPKYTVIPMLRSRWCSNVSTSPSRTPTERPVSWLTAASAWEAPRARASSRARSMIDAKSSGARRNGLLGATAIVISN